MAHWKLFSGLVVLGALFAFQQPFRQYPGIEYYDFPLPPDWQQKSEWTFARLMYPQARGSFRGYGRYGNGDWRQGLSMWTQDYPRADRHFAQAVRRLTRIHTRSVEQPVNLDDGDDVFNWPWLYAVQVGHWDLTDQQARKLRDYLLRGGFFMCDDFWGDVDWDVFLRSMKRVFPDRPIVDLEDSAAIFHTVFDLDDRYQVPGARYLSTWRDLEMRELPGALARHLRRQGAPDGGDDTQLRYRRLLGVRRRSALSGKIFRARNPHRRELHRLRHDALICATLSAWEVSHALR